VSTAKEGQPPPQTEAQRLSEITRQSIVGPIRAHELQNGGVGGPVVVSLEQTARHGLTPNFGHAIFSINVDALGVVVSVGVEDASSDRREWEEIATQSLAALAQKRVHLPPGSKGAQIRVELTSRVQMPSGSTRPVTVQPFGAADPSSNTLPVVSGSFDVSDIGAHPLRVVGARELSENIF